MVAVQHLYQYPYHSSLNNNQLKLSTTVSEQGEAIYFQGSFKQPRITAMCLRTLSDVVQSRFYIPPAMLAALALTDPVITTSRQMIRFEGFSSCCSAYARLDLLPESLECDELIPGTTNVDFHDEMRNALSRVRDEVPLSMTVGEKEIQLHSERGDVVEKKVKLPVRWMKGFAEIQSIQTSMTLQGEYSRAMILPLIRQIPNTYTRHTLWFKQMGRQIRSSTRQSPGAFAVNAAERLHLFDALLPFMKTMRVYADVKAQVSAWVMDLGGLRLTLILSANRWRGFSGEGQLLEALAQSDDEVLSGVKAALNWQDEIDIDALADQLGMGKNVILQSLAQLATRGLVGYDLDQTAYFHRVLPFDQEKVLSLHPRLKDAQKLIDEKKVDIISKGEVTQVEVHSKDVVHRVTLSADGDRCTCPWYVKHGVERGPCKHILAAQMQVEAEGQ